MCLLGAVREVPAKYKRITLWVVTYDLPAPNEEEKKTPPGRIKLAVRRRFYRRVRKWLQEHEGSRTYWMTLSTVITQDREFAEFLIDEVSDTAGGVGSLYRANMLKFCGLPRQLQPPKPYDREQFKFMWGKE